MELCPVVKFFLLEDERPHVVLCQGWFGSRTAFKLIEHPLSWAAISLGLSHAWAESAIGMV